MKLPWDKNYLKISFHVIVTVIAIYILSLMVKNISQVSDTTFQFLKTLLMIMGPVITALIFSYLINPLVEFFQNLYYRIAKKRPNPEQPYCNRLQGTIFTYIFIAVLLFVSGRVIAIKIGATDINDIAKSISDSIQGFGDMLVLLQVKLADMGILENVDTYLQQGIQTLTGLATNYISSFVDSITKAGGWVLNLGIGITAAFYFLVEKEKILYYCRDILDVFLKEKWSKRVQGICHDVNSIFSGYIGGQVTDAIIVAILISTAFSIFGIRYPVIIGVISGLSNLIPYVGAIVAFVLSVGVGLLSGTPIKALTAAIIVIVIQQLDGMFIVPKVVGKSVELHPALVLLSLSVFGSVFGILGMIVAVPCTAIGKLFLVRLYYRRKEEQ